jgi:hypothetical protein
MFKINILKKWLKIRQTGIISLFCLFCASEIKRRKWKFSHKLKVTILLAVPLVALGLHMASLIISLLFLLTFKKNEATNNKY